MTNEKVSVIEERHTDLGLKDRGGTEISDRLFLISWRICGEEYALLAEQGVVRDVLKFPKHSKDSPQFIGSCQLNGHDVPGTAIGVLKNEKGVEILPAVTAWALSNLKVAVGFAFTGAVVGEFVASSRGLGYLLSFAQSTYNASLTLALLLLIMVFVFMLFALAGRVEKRLLRWR